MPITCTVLYGVTIVVAAKLLFEVHDTAELVATVLLVTICILLFSFYFLTLVKPWFWKIRDLAIRISGGIYMTAVASRALGR